MLIIIMNAGQFVIDRVNMMGRSKAPIYWAFSIAACLSGCGGNDLNENAKSPIANNVIFVPTYPSVSYPLPPPQPQLPELWMNGNAEKWPEEIKILLEFDQYEIKSYRIDSDIFPLNGIRFVGRHADNQRAYLKFDPIVNESAVSNLHFYILELPPVKSGVHRATIKKIYNPVPGWPLPVPLDRIGITCQVSDGEITKYSIDSLVAQTYQLYVVDQPDPGTDLAYVVVNIRSRLYKGEEWLVKVPKEDGEFDLVAMRREFLNAENKRFY